MRAFEIDLHSSEKAPELCFGYSAYSVRVFAENHKCLCHKIWGPLFSVLHIEKGYDGLIFGLVSGERVPSFTYPFPDIECARTDELHCSDTRFPRN